MPNVAAFDATHLASPNTKVEGVNIKAGAAGWARNDHDFRSGNNTAGNGVTMEKHGRQRTINLRPLRVEGYKGRCNAIMNAPKQSRVRNDHPCGNALFDNGCEYTISVETEIGFVAPLTIIVDEFCLRARLRDPGADVVRIAPGRDHLVIIHPDRDLVLVD